MARSCSVMLGLPKAFLGEGVQGGGRVRLELLYLFGGPLGVPVQGAVVVQAGGGGHPEQRVALRGRQHAEHRAQAEEADAGPPERAFGGGVAVGPGHHVNAGIRSLVGQPDQLGRDLARPAVVALGQQFMPAVHPGDEEEPFGLAGRPIGGGQPGVQVGDEIVQRRPGRPAAGDPHLVRQVLQRGEETVKGRRGPGELGDGETTSPGERWTAALSRVASSRPWPCSSLPR